MSAIHDLYKNVSTYLNTNPNFERDLITEMSKLTSKASNAAMNSDESFCFKFYLPIKTVVKKFPTFLNVSKDDIFDAFKQDWGSGAMSNHMHQDPYYQILLLVLYYGIQERKEKISNNAFQLVMFKIWNGRKHTYLQYCNKDVMRYVVHHMCNNRHIFSKYNDPYNMIISYFIPTLLKKYEYDIKRDSKKLKTLFEQSYTRIRQLFVQRNRVNIKTGQPEAQGGILPMYKYAREQGLSLSTKQVYSNNDDSSPEFSDYLSVNARDDIIQNVIDKITLNRNPRYDPGFISSLNKKYKVKRSVIETILKSLHNDDYEDYLNNILVAILSQMDVSSKADICSNKFNQQFERKIIQSKNNVKKKKLDSELKALLDSILQKELNKNLQQYSNVQAIQLKKVCLMGIVHNLKQVVC